MARVTRAVFEAWLADHDFATMVSRARRRVRWKELRCGARERKAFADRLHAQELSEMQRALGMDGAT